MRNPPLQRISVDTCVELSIRPLQRFDLEVCEAGIRQPHCLGDAVRARQIENEIRLTRTVDSNWCASEVSRCEDGSEVLASPHLKLTEIFSFESTSKLLRSPKYVRMMHRDNVAAHWTRFWHVPIIAPAWRRSSSVHLNMQVRRASRERTPYRALPMAKYAAYARRSLTLRALSPGGGPLGHPHETPLANQRLSLREITTQSCIFNSHALKSRPRRSGRFLAALAVLALLCRSQVSLPRISKIIGFVALQVSTVDPQIHGPDAEGPQML